MTRTLRCWSRVMRENLDLRFPLTCILFLTTLHSHLIENYWRQALFIRYISIIIAYNLTADTLIILMRITKKEKVDVKKFMEEIKANRTNRSFTSLESKNRPDSKNDQLRGNLYQSVQQENSYNGFEDSRKSYEQAHNSMRYNYPAYSNPPNEYMMPQPSQNFMISQPSQNFIPNNSYCYPYTFSQSFTPPTPINPINPINAMNHMRPAPINQFQEQPAPFMNTYSNQPERQNSSVTHKNEDVFSKNKDKIETIVLPEVQEDKEKVEIAKSKEENKTSLVVQQADDVTKEKKKGRKKKTKQNVDTSMTQPSEEKPKQKDPVEENLKMEKICDDILSDFNSRLQNAYQKTMSSSKLTHFQTKSQTILSALSHFPPHPKAISHDTLFQDLKAILIKNP